MEYIYIDIKDYFDEYKKIFPDFNTINKANGIAGQNAIWFAAMMNGNLIGFYTIYINFTDIILYNFGIIKEYQNQKYGKIILKDIINKYNKYDIIVFIDKTNIISKKLFQNAGFIIKNNKFIPPIGQICLIKKNT